MDDAHPPRPRLALNLGITGHRASILPPALIDQLLPVANDVFQSLRGAVERFHQREKNLFENAAPRLRLHTPLASGADQLAATSARAAGYTIRALLPFTPEDYRHDFAPGAERDEFEGQLEAADEVFALPGERGDEEGAYVLVGKGVAAAADILIAIWDGREGNGPGGTAHVVNLALANAIPVIHINVDPPQGTVGRPCLLSRNERGDTESIGLGCAEDYDQLVRDTLGPHTVDEKEHIFGFLGEQRRTHNWRIEYSGLLAILGIKPLSRSSWREAWSDLDTAAASSNGEVRHLAAYEWANVLAIRYAQLFRSGHVANYVLSALAVILALFGLLAPHIKVLLVLAELATIGLLFLNTNAGTKAEWHRRWLQYRQLAESLRALPYLKRSGLISTPFRSDFVHGAAHREAGTDWTRWYAAAVWRDMESPKGIVTNADILKLGAEFLQSQVIPQAQYHRVNGDRMYKLDNRLHEIGNFLTSAVIGVCALYVVGYLAFPGWAKSLTNPFIFLTAGLPAIGAAVFGLRGHGEHLLAASRSANTATALEATGPRLAQAADMETLARDLEHSASIMLADLNEWTIAYRERSLEIPA